MIYISAFLAELLFCLIFYHTQIQARKNQGKNSQANKQPTHVQAMQGAGRCLLCNHAKARKTKRVPWLIQARFHPNCSSPSTIQLPIKLIASIHLCLNVKKSCEIAVRILDVVVLARSIVVKYPCQHLFLMIIVRRNIYKTSQLNI